MPAPPRKYPLQYINKEEWDKAVKFVKTTDKASPVPRSLGLGARPGPSRDPGPPLRFQESGEGVTRDSGVLFIMWGFLPELEKVPPTENNYIDFLMDKLREVDKVMDIEPDHRLHPLAG